MNLLWILVLNVVVLLVVLILVGRMVFIQYRRMRKQIKEKDLFTNITHEILTPLTVVAASVELLRTHDEEHARDYDIMDINIQRVVRLLQQILETSKSEAGELKLRVSNGDVMTYIRETSHSLEPLMARQELQFHVDCNPETMLGWIDTDKLDKILFNLLSNAAKYSGKKGEVWVDVSTNSTYDHITIQVRDNGVGMSQERMKHLFDRFNDGEYRRNHTIGTGLGLSLTRDLVYLHGGNIHCASTPGQGTVFSVVLPINKEAFTVEQRDDQTPLEVKIPKYTIEDVQEHLKALQQVNSIIESPDEDAYKLLIVEDNVELLMLMKQLLSEHYHVYTATNGKEALNMVEQYELDLIVSDMMMPVMDGNELMVTLKGNPDYSHLPIIILTAKSQEDDRVQALANGADEYIVKPFKLRDLRLRIDNIIKNRQRIQHDFKTQAINPTETQNHVRLSADQEFLNRAMACVNAHLSDADYDREHFAADMSASTSTLYNKLRSITGMSVSSFIRNARMKSACDIIRQQPGIRVSDLAYQVGFRDPKYFATIFKKEYGMQPTEYMELEANKVPKR